MILDAERAVERPLRPPRAKFSIGCSNREGWREFHSVQSSPFVWRRLFSLLTIQGLSKQERVVLFNTEPHKNTRKS
ncbi:MAG: hypothetical protein M2R45_03970 [Verrucomicrobia subdivision 3 bacterium]|nr:hypothetical protein [Limisphaerales bacterium]MCS1415510.1 hypothetical protein [Limisphaerales bacterium]